MSKVIYKYAKIYYNKFIHITYILIYNIHQNFQNTLKNIFSIFTV